MSEWMNIGIKDVNIQTLINLWSNGQLLDDTQLNALLNVYGLELVNLPYQSVRFYKSGSNFAYISVDRSNTSLTIRDKYFISQTIKFKGTTDRQTKTFTKTSDNIYIIAEQTTWNNITLYLNEFGMEVLGGGYTWNQENLLQNATYNPESNVSIGAPVAYSNGCLTFRDYKTLGKSISAIGSNKPIPNTHHSFDVKDSNGIQGYRYFDLINTNEHITYIGYWGENNTTFEGGGHWSALDANVYVDALGQEYNGPFLVLKYNNKYRSVYEKADWTKDSENTDIWWVKNFDLVPETENIEWFVYANSYTKNKIGTSCYDALTKYVNWGTKNITVDCKSWQHYAISFELKVKIPYFTANVNLINRPELSTIGNPPSEVLITDSDQTNTHDLVQKDDGVNTPYCRATRYLSLDNFEYWKTGNYTERNRKWYKYTTEGGTGHYADSSINICKDTGGSATGAIKKDIQIAKITWPIKLMSSIPNSYQYNKDASKRYNWDAQNIGTHLVFKFGAAENADMWIMRDFADIKWGDNILSTISVATSDWPAKKPDRVSLPNSLSTWRSITASGNKLEYGFFTVYADNNAPDYMYLIFAVKDLNGNDF